MLALNRTVDASEEPVSLVEAKAHLRVDGTDDDAYITALILAARKQCEEITNRVFVTQTWEYLLNEFPASGRIDVPFPPLASITSVEYLDGDGNNQTLAASVYDVHPQFTIGRVELGYEQTWPTTREQSNAVTVTFVAGYGDATAVPEPIKQAILLIVGSLYGFRETMISGTIIAEIPFGAEALLSPYRVFDWR